MTIFLSVTGTAPTPTHHIHGVRVNNSFIDWDFRKLTSLADDAIATTDRVGESNERPWWVAWNLMPLKLLFHQLHSMDDVLHGHSWSSSFSHRLDFQDIWINLAALVGLKNGTMGWWDWRWSHLKHRSHGWQGKEDCWFAASLCTTASQVVSCLARSFPRASFISGAMETIMSDCRLYWRSW